MTILFFRHTNGLWIVNAYSNATLLRVAGRKFLYEQDAEAFANELKG